MTTEEGNKLIAEFIGGKLIDEYSYNQHWIFPNPEGMEENVGGKQYKLLFHSSWDWLMPAYIKTRKWVDEQDWSKLNNEGYYLFKLVQRNIRDGHIIEVFNYLSEFIKWYNTQNK